MKEYVTLIGVEEAQNAARRLEEAAQNANRAADRLEEAVRQFRALTESGYGNNIERLIDLLEDDDQGHN